MENVKFDFFCPLLFEIGLASFYYILSKKERVLKNINSSIKCELLKPKKKGKLSMFEEIVKNIKTSLVGEFKIFKVLK